MSKSGESAPLRKLIAISNFGDFIGGGEYSFFDVVYNITNYFSPLVVVPKKGILADRLRTKNIATRLVSLPELRPWLFLCILKTIQSLRRTAETENACLIYANGSRPAFYGGIVGRTLKIPIIWHCRIAERDYRLDSVLSRLSNIIIVNSQATAKRFSQQIQHKIRIIYNGIDNRWLKDKGISGDEVRMPNGRILLVVARVSKWKRHDLALSAFEEMAGAHPDLQLVLIGAKDPLESDWWKYLQKKTADSSYADRIHWIGSVEDVRPWYRAASILLLPSDNEPFGRVLVEAMACGVPIVATRGGGVPEIVRNGKDGILVPMGKRHEMADAIRRILGDDFTKAKMSKSGQERAKEFSLESHIKSIICAFEETIDNKKTILSNRVSNELKISGS
jgi:glycosyltransferase involved in cell wall biosynthesis